MLSNVKAIALLMLAAGLALGVFAGTLLAGPPEASAPGSRVDAAIEARVRLYVEQYGLDEVRADQVRRILTKLKRELHDELMQVYRQRLERFRTLHDRATEQILGIVAPGSRTPGAAGGADRGK